MDLGWQHIVPGAGDRLCKGAAVFGDKPNFEFLISKP